MSKIREWLEATACPTLDMERNERVEDFAKQVVRAMRREGSFFSFRDTTDLLKVPLEDLVLVKERVYELTLNHVMEDFQITERDQAGLAWIARNLRLEPADAHRVQLRVGRRVFDEYLAFSISGGHLSDEEIAEFRRLAESLGTTTRQLLLLYLADSGEAFLKMVLDVFAESPRINPKDWRRLTASLGALGLDEQELIRVLRAQATRLRETLRATTRRTQQTETHEETLERLTGWLNETSSGSSPVPSNPPHQAGSRPRRAV
jgi:hypothetical protein